MSDAIAKGPYRVFKYPSASGDDFMYLVEDTTTDVTLLVCVHSENANENCKLLNRAWESGYEAGWLESEASQ